MSAWKELALTTESGTRTTTEPLSTTLKSRFRGRVLAPGDVGYDEARTVFSATFDARPAMIVRAADAEDVARAVGLARESGLELAVRSGGHSGAGHSTTVGGVVLDLRDLNRLEIDRSGHTAWAGAGLTAGEFTAAAGAHGLAAAFGDDVRGLRRRCRRRRDH